MGNSQILNKIKESISKLKSPLSEKEVYSLFTSDMKEIITNENKSLSIFNESVQSILKHECKDMNISQLNFFTSNLNLLLNEQIQLEIYDYLQGSLEFINYFIRHVYIIYNPDLDIDDCYSLFNLIDTVLRISVDDRIKDSFIMTRTPVELYYLSYNTTSFIYFLLIKGVCLNQNRTHHEDKPSSQVNNSEDNVMIRYESLNIFVYYLVCRKDNEKIKKFYEKTFLNYKLHLFSIKNNIIDKVLYNSQYYTWDFYSNFILMCCYILTTLPSNYNLYILDPIFYKKNGELDCDLLIKDSKTMRKIGKIRKYRNEHENFLVNHKEIYNIINYFTSDLRKSIVNLILDYQTHFNDLAILNMDSKNELYQSFMLIVYKIYPDFLENLLLKTDFILNFLYYFKENNIYDLYLLCLLSYKTNFPFAIGNLETSKLVSYTGYYFNSPIGFFLNKQKKEILIIDENKQLKNEYLYRKILDCYLYDSNNLNMNNENEFNSSIMTNYLKMSILDK